MLSMTDLAHWIDWIKSASHEDLVAAANREFDTDLEVTDLLQRLATSVLRRQAAAC